MLWFEAQNRITLAQGRRVFHKNQIKKSLESRDMKTSAKASLSGKGSKASLKSFLPTSLPLLFPLKPWRALSFHMFYNSLLKKMEKVLNLGVFLIILMVSVFFFSFFIFVSIKFYFLKIKQIILSRSLWFWIHKKETGFEFIRKQLRFWIRYFWFDRN